MVSWRQFWHAYLTSSRLPENDTFRKMALRSGWKETVVLRCLGWTLYLVYPANVNDVPMNDNRIL